MGDMVGGAGGLAGGAMGDMAGGQAGEEDESAPDEVECPDRCRGGEGNVRKLMCSDPACTACPAELRSTNCGPDACPATCLGGAGNVRRLKCSDPACSTCPAALFDANCNGGGGVGEGGDPTTFGTPNGGGLDGGLGDMAGGGGGAAGTVAGGLGDQTGGGVGGGFSGDPAEFVNGNAPQTPANYKDIHQDRACFPGLSLVHVRREGGIEKEQRRMDDLRPGDAVLVEREGPLLSWEPVLGFLHALPSASPANVVEIRHEHGNFSASAAHIVKVETVAGPRERFVGEVKVGDRLYAATLSGDSVQQTRVLSSEHKVTNSGLWAPYTAAGTIVVDNIVASAYASPSPRWPLPHAAAHTVLFLPRVLAQYIPGWSTWDSEEAAWVPEGTHPLLEVLETAFGPSAASMKRR
eukprot:TRINITY_DN3069_c0_g1_i4.p1 TRINITY_DN3069_c0_g1~~TRINITY_DN3069_c0_g1_i4.p1  ORF type:complete len:408 (+),score=62.34 TRINITY_DN3069_c0_g1_i4:697-1920(+)